MLQRRPRGGLVIAVALAALLIVIALMQSVEWREFDQRRPEAGEPAPSVVATSSIGQSLTISHANFDWFDFRLSNGEPIRAGRVKLRLHRGDANGATLPIVLSDAGNGLLITPPAPAGQYYVEISGSTADLAALGVIYSPQGNYSGGQLYVDGKAQDGDLSFHVTYRYYLLQGLGDALGGLLGSLWPLLCALLLYLLPGRALLALLPLATLNFAQRILAAPFVTLAALPLALLWLKPTGLALGGWQMWLLVLISGAIVVWDERRRIAAGDGWRNLHGWWAYALLGGYIALALVARLLAAQPLVAGSGIDGYHHTLITQMILERGSLPGDYLPYAPLSSFTYHYGFHALAAALGWLDGQDSVTLMLLTGQALSAILIAALYVFVEYIWHNRLMALAAAYIVGLLTIFPAFYVNWSRYTQLAGLAVLPVALLLLVIATRQPRIHWGSIALAVMGAGGLLLVHYRIWMTYLTFAALYALTLLLGWRIIPLPAGGADQSPLPVGGAGGGSESGQSPTPNPSRREGRAMRMGGRRVPAWLPSLVLTAILGGLAVLPWLLNLRANFTTRIVNNTTSSTTAGFFDLNELIGRQPLEYFSTVTLLVLAGAGALLLVWEFDRWGVLLLDWVGLHVLLSNPYWLRLPFAGLVDNVTLIQSSFIPIAIGAGYMVARLLGGGARLMGLYRTHPPPDAPALIRAAKLGLAIVTLAGGLAAIPPQLNFLDAKPYVLAQDRAAMVWIAAHTPPDARFLVSDFGFNWAPTLAQGSDAGLWLPLLTRLAGGDVAQVRASTAPPQPTYNERIADPNYLAMTFDTTIASTKFNDEGSWGTLKRYGISYIYVGSRGGVVRASALAGNPHAVLVWHQDDVWVYKIDYNARLPQRLAEVEVNLVVEAASLPMQA